MLRSDIQADKNQIITDTMAFSDQESAAFWPVYRNYARDQQVIGDDRWKLIMDSAQHYDSMDNAKAADLAQQMFSIDSRTVKLRQDLLAEIRKSSWGKAGREVLSSG